MTVGRKTVTVCKAALLGLHGINESRLKKKVLNFSKSIADSRGKHGNRRHIPDDIRQRVRHHIERFPARESHYSRSKNLCLCLVDRPRSHMNEVHLRFPIPGHSRMLCDRDFGRIEKKKMKKDRVTKLSEWVSLIKETDRNQPFEVVFVEHCVTNDMKDDGTPVKKVYNYKAAFDPLVKHF